jgi:hypothetical protein
VLASYSHLRWAILILVFSIGESTKAVIQRKVEIIQCFRKPNPEVYDSTSQINPVLKKHLARNRHFKESTPRCREVKADNQGQRKQKEGGDIFAANCRAA